MPPLKLNLSASGDELVGLFVSCARKMLTGTRSVLQVPFLNLMANIQQRVGKVNVRVGGNTQETAVLVSQTPDGKILEKDTINTSNPVSRPRFLSRLLFDTKMFRLKHHH